jgi:septum site-determining protein MinD
MAGQVVAVASGKGGVGKTTTVANLGVVLRRSNHSVALVDADLGMANLGPMLGISGDPTLHDVLADTADLDQALVTETTGFAMLPGSQTLNDFSEADPAGLRTVLDSLAEEYEYVLVDTGAGVTHEGVLPLGLADQVLLVTSPDPAAVENTRKTAELTELADGVIAGVVVTKADETIDAEEIADSIGVNLLGVIPFDPTVRRSTAAGEPLEAVDPDSPAAEAYRNIATVLTTEAVESSEDALSRAPDSPGSADQSAETAQTEPATDSEPAGAEAPADETAAASPDSGQSEPAKPEPPESNGKSGQGSDETAQAAEPESDSSPQLDTAGESAATELDPAPDPDAGPSEAPQDGADDSTPDETPPSAPDSSNGAHEDAESAEAGGLFGWFGRLFR